MTAFPNCQVLGIGADNQNFLLLAIPWLRQDLYADV
jgi:hypothetical protein